MGMTTPGLPDDMKYKRRTEMTEPKLPAKPTPLPLAKEGIDSLRKIIGGEYVDDADSSVNFLCDQALAAIALRSELTSALARVAEREGGKAGLVDLLAIAHRERFEANARAEAAEKDARSSEQRFQMYRNAWVRELKKVFPKHYEIDALVMTTKYYRENYEQWKKVVRETNDERQRQALAEWMPAAIDAMVKP